MPRSYNKRGDAKRGLRRVFRRALQSLNADFSTPDAETSTPDDTSVVVRSATLGDMSRLAKMAHKWAPIIEQVTKQAKQLDHNAYQREWRYRQSRKPKPPRPWVERAWCNACNRTRVVGHEDHWRKE